MKREYKPVTTRKRPTKKYTRAPRYQTPTSVVKKAGGLYFPRTRTVNAPLPQTFRTSLEYAQYYQLQPTATDIAERTFRLNSLFDPDLTGTGHQPRGFDELASFYGRYTVVGCTIQVHLLNSFTTASIAMAFLCSGQVGLPTPITGTLWREIGEYPKGNIVYRLQPSGQSNNVMIIKKTANMGQILGIPDVLSEAEAGAVVDSNPTKTVFGTLWVGSPTDVDIGEVSVAVKLTYDVIFQNTKQPQSS